MSGYQAQACLGGEVGWMKLTGRYPVCLLSALLYDICRDGGMEGVVQEIEFLQGAEDQDQAIPRHTDAKLQLTCTYQICF